MTEEEKGFVIKDRRSLDEKGDLKDAKSEEGRDKAARKEDAAEGKGAKAESQAPLLPEVNFSSLIFSLSSTALFHLGEIADPKTGKRSQDLPLAKHSIDTIAMLKEKTEGNLTEDEQKFTENVLADLRWRYVTATK
ncbi:MAG: DUF1844 domain-containing protein [Desulfatiglandaceae bacterium]|jgi:hypothetical protein